MASRKKKPTTTVNVDAVKKDVQKMIQSHDPKPQNPGFSPGGFGEVAPGSVNRQSLLEQQMGTSKYKQMIHDHNDKNKHVLDRLPFTFPRKKVVRSHLDVLLECPECQEPVYGTEHTVGIVCPGCKKYVSVKNLEAESRGYNPDLKVGVNGTAADKIRKKQLWMKKNNPNP